MKDLGGKHGIRDNDMLHAYRNPIRVQAGQHIEVVQVRLGHASIRTTLDIYGHLLPGLDEEDATALDQATLGPDVVLG